MTECNGFDGDAIQPVAASDTASESNSRASSPDVLSDVSRDRRDSSSGTNYAAVRKQLKQVVRPLTPPPSESKELSAEKPSSEFQSRMTLEKETKRLAKTDLEEQKIREKLRSMPTWKKEILDKRKIKGPMIAKPPSPAPSSSSSVLSSTTSSVSSSTSTKDTLSSSSHIPRMRRTTPPPSPSESPFTRQVVNRPVSPTLPRRRSSSSPTGNKPSPTAYSRRTPSPQGGDSGSALTQEEARKKVEKVQRARLYLLQQNGPNSFTIGGDSPDNKFKVIIGPQKCSCGKGSHCIHLLFVMLRVFQVTDSDPLLWSRELKNFEVEAFFQKYHARRKSLLKKLSRSTSFKNNKSSGSSKDNSNASETLSTPNSEQSSTKDDEEVCPICLLEMIEGESLVVCQDGCHNKLHHHCVAIWADECRRTKELLICPLCRASWNLVGQFSDSDSQAEAVTVPPNTRSSSPAPAEVVLPQAESIPLEHVPKAQPWIEVFGSDLVCCLFSRNWVTRETGLHHLSRDVVGALLPGVGEGRARANVTAARQSTTNSVLETCCNILAMMCSDPVYKVYVTALRTVRTMLAYLPCRDEQQKCRLQSFLKPVIAAILFKCADGNRRTSQLSISTLVELCRGQQGELAIGREILNPGPEGIGSVKFVMSTIMTSQNTCTTSSTWQWLLGRLYVVDKLLDEFSHEFSLGTMINNGVSSAFTFDDSSEVIDICYENQEFLFSILRFTLPAITNAHCRVAKYAKRIFVNISHKVVHSSAVFGRAFEMLEELPATPSKRMKRRLLAINEEYQNERERAARLQSGDDDFSGPLTPFSTPADTPHCNSPDVSPQNTLELDHLVNVARRSLQHNELYDTHITSVSEGILTPPPTPKERKSHSHTRKRTDAQQPSTSKGASSQEETRVPKPSKTEASAQEESRLSRPSNFHFGTKSMPVCGSKNKQMLERNESQDRASDTTEDLSDLSSVFSPMSPTDKAVSFKTEVATSSPKHHPKYKEDVTQLHCCQATVEAEEAEALAIAMKSSVSQTALPIVPGLSSEDEDEFTVHVQPEGKGDETDKGNVYLEKVHWTKGPMIGSGAFSSCYQARDIKSGTIMAVKQVSFCRNSKPDQEKVVSAILEEICMMARIDHPNVTRLIGATQQGAHFNLFVEWMPGGSVSSLLERYGAFQEPVIIRYMQQILHGIAYLHDNQIIHRDLKGANILLDSTGHHLRVADFGAAARMVAKSTMTGEFQGQLLGTIAFMAPEVLRGETYGRSCDIWSVGCCLVEMATSKPPWNGEVLSNHLALIFKIASTKGPPKIPDSISPALRDLGLRCLEHAPEDRPSAKELLKHAVFTRL